MITITCPRCGNDFQTEGDKGTAVCPTCSCRLLLKRRGDDMPGLDPDGGSMGVDDALDSFSRQEDERNIRSTAADDASHLEEALERGDSYLKQNQYNQALYVFKNAAVSAPDDYRAWWGVTTATLHHLCAYLEMQRLLTNVSPVNNVYGKQIAAAEKAMEQVRLLAPEDYKGMLEERYNVECAAAREDLRQALKIIKKNIRIRNGFKERLTRCLIACGAGLLLLIMAIIVKALPVRLVLGIAGIGAVAAGLVLLKRKV